MDGNYISVAHVADFAGTILNYALNSTGTLPNSAWIIDTEESNHILHRHKPYLLLFL